MPPSLTRSSATRLDEAGMRLRMLVGRLRLGQLAGEGVDIEMALAGAVDAIGPVQAGVEPLRRVRRDALGGEHVGELVAEGERVVLARRNSRPSSPNRSRCRRAGRRPGARRSRRRSARPRAARRARPRRHRAPQEGGDVVLLDLLQPRRHAGLAEIFLGQDVGRDLAELRRHVDVVEPEDDRAVRVLDLATAPCGIRSPHRRLARLGETTFDAHLVLSQSLYIAPCPQESSQIPCQARPQVSRPSTTAGAASFGGLRLAPPPAS